MVLDTNSLANFYAGGGRLEMCHTLQKTSPDQLTPAAQFIGGQLGTEVDSCVDEQSEKVRVLEEELALLRREQSKLTEHL